METFSVDTNVAVYAFSKDDRRLKAMELLGNGPRISIQLLNEFANVSLRKKGLQWDEIHECLDIILRLSRSSRPVDISVHELGKNIAQRYQINLYDALVIAAALLDGCETLYSEDMQHGLVIDGTLKIINPFQEPQ